MYYAILNAIQSIIGGLSLIDWNGKVLATAIRKLPKVDESLDTLPLLCIVPKDEPPKRLPLCFGNGGIPTYKVSYPCEIAAIAAGNRDFSSNLSTYTGWQSSIINAFKWPSPLTSLVPSVWDVNVRPGLVIDRQQVNDNYDYGGLTVEVVTSE